MIGLTINQLKESVTRNLTNVVFDVDGIRCGIYPSTPDSYDVGIGERLIENIKDFDNLLEVKIKGKKLSEAIGEATIDIY
ncbi:hypothetical protein [Facklamia hominis]|uniref:Uncharacterized protein n=2 Tax=Facklamia hominis TaxID=178214 RepID=K1MKG2_9LACT|nr:hypothetical protein [Facklamia hominis]EKB56424.1 hypothetical protein HMPREF9706_00407 [Facklamia hominis CCUG 36813]MDK7187151.1 hypothetical protein [Facklamia hominis]RYC98933.1 hypothetical protein EKN08_00435 [Facklamia hominis]WPJ91559.1 hypothetical protein R0V13_04150 [Facklamia hominis]